MQTSNNRALIIRTPLVYRNSHREPMLRAHGFDRRLSPRPGRRPHARAEPDPCDQHRLEGVAWDQPGATLN